MRHKKTHKQANIAMSLYMGSDDGSIKIVLQVSYPSLKCAQVNFAYVTKVKNALEIRVSPFRPTDTCTYICIIHYKMLTSQRCMHLSSFKRDTCLHNKILTLQRWRTLPVVRASSVRPINTPLLYAVSIHSGRSRLQWPWKPPTWPPWLRNLPSETQTWCTGKKQSSYAFLKEPPPFCRRKFSCDGQMMAIGETFGKRYFFMAVRIRNFKPNRTFPCSVKWDIWHALTQTVSLTYVL